MIFDCDGVLVDSEPLSGGILVERLNAEGLHWRAEDADRDFLGRSWANNIEVIEARHGPLPAGFSERYHDELFAAFERELRPVPGIEAALDAIELPSCVASSGEHARIRRVLGMHGAARALRRAHLQRRGRRERQAGARPVPARGAGRWASTPRAARWSRTARRACRPAARRG